MAKLTRQHQKVFGLDHNLSEVKKFGSLAAGSPANALNPEEVQSLSKFTDGWFSAVIGANSPTIEDRNALDYVFGYQLAYLMETGVPEWNALTTYYIGSIVSVNGELYGSLSNNNLNNSVNGSEWKQLVRPEQLLNIPPNIILSGKIRTTSSQPQFIKPNGAAASVTVEGLGTNLVFYANNVKGVVSTDIVIAGLTLAPAANNTCLVNDTDATGQESTRTWGEKDAEKEYILIDTIGTEISSRVGEWVVFKISTEFFIGYVEADRISRIKRGYFTNSSGNPLNRTTFSNNAIITIMSTAYIFADIDGTTIDTSYTNPTYSDTAPSAPASGDYWLDTTNEIWKEYDGAAWNDSTKNLIGIAVIDNANCVAARSCDFHKNISNENDIEVEIESVTKIISKSNNYKVNVYGKLVYTGQSLLEWDISSNLATATEMYNSVEQASTLYYLYIDENRKLFISDISPLENNIHPHNTWRCVGIFFNDSSSNITLVDEIKYNPNIISKTLFFKDVKASGTNGGTFSTGVWLTRVLNTKEGNSGFGSLSTNQISLIDGRYLIEATAPANSAGAVNIGNNKAKFENITDTIDELIGDSTGCQSGGGSTVSTTKAKVVGEILVVGGKTFEVKHRCTGSTASTNGLGGATALGVDEIYTQVKATKIL